MFSAPFSANPFCNTNNQDPLLSLLSENMNQQQPLNFAQHALFNPYLPSGSQRTFLTMLAENASSQAAFNPYSTQATLKPYISPPSDNSAPGILHRKLLQELTLDRNRDLALDNCIYILANSIQTPRRTDHLVRQLIQGLPIDKRQAVCDILADRVKDKVISKVVQVILEDKRHDRAIDSSITMLKSGMVPGESSLMQQLDKNARQQAFDTNLFQSLQRVKSHDQATLSRFEGGKSCSWGFPSEPSFSVENPPGYFGYSFSQGLGRQCGPGIQCQPESLATML